MWWTRILIKVHSERENIVLMSKGLTFLTNNICGQLLAQVTAVELTSASILNYQGTAMLTLLITERRDW